MKSTISPPFHAHISSSPSPRASNRTITRGRRQRLCGRARIQKAQKATKENKFEQGAFRAACSECQKFCSLRLCHLVAKAKCIQIWTINRSFLVVEVTQTHILTVLILYMYYWKTLIIILTEAKYYHLDIFYESKKSAFHWHCLCCFTPFTWTFSISVGGKMRQRHSCL